MSQEQEQPTDTLTTLVAASDPLVAGLLSGMLGQRNHQVEVQKNSQDALDWFSRNVECTLVLVAWPLKDDPDLNLVAKLKSLPAVEAPLVLVVNTDPENPPEAARLEERGVDLYLERLDDADLLNLRLKMAETYQRLRQNLGGLLNGRQKAAPKEVAHKVFGLLPNLVVGFDAEGQLSYLNDFVLGTLGFSREELLGDAWWEKMNPNAESGTTDKIFIQEVLADRRQPPKDATMATLWDKFSRRIEVEWRHIMPGDGHLYRIGSIIEQTEEAQADGDEPNGAPLVSRSGQFDWDLSDDRMLYSPELLDLLGFDPGGFSLVADEWFKRVHPKDIKQLRGDLDNYLTGLIGSLSNQHRVRNKQGAYLWMECTATAQRDEQGKALRLSGKLEDISEKKGHDPLTGLPKKALFVERLQRFLDREAIPKQTPYVLLLAGLDRIKVINDSLGRKAGDMLLTAAGQKLENLAEEKDLVARLEGDQFALLLVDPKGKRDPTTMAEKIQADFQKLVHLDQRDLFTTTSIGIVVGDERYRRAQNLLRDGDVALVRAKSKGRACYHIFEAGTHAAAVERIELEGELRQAIERNELRVFYQPLVYAHNNRLYGFEALVRWQHPTRGLLPPGLFIPLAEDSGLVDPLNRWVFADAVGQVRQWIARYPMHKNLRISVNLSPSQFSHPTLVEDMSTILHNVGLPPDNVSLEITENILVGDPDTVTKLLQRFRDTGVHLSIDDFGTGYSCLSYLHRFPVDVIKIDRSFVNQMDGDGKEIIRTILALARHLDMKVVAEGVETKEQLATLKELECDYIQGYYFSRPVPAKDAENFLKK